MWENERKRSIVRNVLIFVVLALVVGALGIAYLQVKQQIAAEDAKLSEANHSQRQELSEQRREITDIVQQAYEKDLATVEQYMPGIVCWGDSITAGSSGNVSYPYTLQKFIDTYICDIYDFRAGLSSAEEIASVKGSEYQVSIPVVNMGAGQENSATILGRAGVAPFRIRRAFEIPADKTPVTISFDAPDGSKVEPLTAGSAGMNPVSIGGVQGNLALVSSTDGWKQTRYEFTRLEEGEALKIEAGTEVIPAVAQEYRDYIHVVCLGAYDPYRNPIELVEDIRQLLARQAKNTDRYLVLGLCTYNSAWKLESSFQLDGIDTAMLQAFGDHYVNVRKYLIEDGLRDAGISPTKEDNNNLSKGFVPHSFQSNATGADLNGLAYKLIGKLVYDRMDRLGYFKEIREELNLDKTTQELLKSNPNYFANMLKLK